MQAHMASETIHISGAAGRYATALFELALEEGQLDAVETSLQTFRTALDESADLQRLVTSPAFTAETQAKALKVIFRVLKLGPLTENFLQLLVKNRRLYTVRNIIKGFQALTAAHRGEVTAEVISAAPLTQDQMQRISASIRDGLGKTARIDARVDPSLLGGLIVKVGSRMIDTSLKTRLNALKSAMKEVG
jgi:F-type H+-transporting ATPase subunit delta